VWAGSAVIDRKDVGGYRAASARTHTIRTSSREGLLVTSALYLALQYLVEICETENVWIDQICIHQDDPLERGRQVAIMHNIYAGGQRTLVWLGEASEHTSFVQDVLSKIGYRPLDFARVCNASRISISPDIASCAQELCDSADAFDHRIEKAVTDIYSRAWVCVLLQ